MYRRSKLLLAGLAAAAAFSAVVSSASASRISTNERRFRAVWAALQFESAVSAIDCPLTLEGSFHSSTLAKVSGAVIGSVSRASVPVRCTGGTATISAETLPWRIRYQGFSGLLPRFTRVNVDVIDASLRLDPEGANPACTFRFTTENPARMRAEVESSGVVTGLAVDPEALIYPEGFGCGAFGYSWLGTATFTRLGSTNSLSLTLVPDEPPRISPSPVEFGRVEAGGLARRTATITGGTVPATINSIRVTSGNYFAITDPNRCVGARVATGATCSFSVVFVAPEEAERSVSDTVTVSTSVRTLEATVRGST
jgi:hypothetical protein